MGDWIDTLSQWLAAHPQGLALTIALISFGECLAIAGLLLPGSTLLFPLAALAGSGLFPLGDVLLLGFAGGLAGDLASYALGQRYHQAIRGLPVLRSHPEWLQASELYFRRYGALSLIIGRIIGPLRPLLPMTAGMLDMRFRLFLPVSLLASLFWSGVYLIPGWITGAAFRLPLPEGFWPEAGSLAAGLAGLLAASLYCSRHPHREPLAAGLYGLALLGLLAGWPLLARLDQGLMNLAQQARQPALEPLVIFVTRLGDSAILLPASLLLVLLLLLGRQHRPALFASLVLSGTMLANSLLKQLFARPRPDVLLEPLSSYSFPSSHSASAFAFCLTLGWLAGRGQPPRLRRFCLMAAGLPALLIALSRVYLGAHWPTDILAGALLAATVGLGSLALVQRQRPLPPLPARSWMLILSLCGSLLLGYASWMQVTEPERYLARPALPASAAQ